MMSSGPAQRPTAVSSSVMTVGKSASSGTRRNAQRHFPRTIVAVDSGVASSTSRLPWRSLLVQAGGRRDGEKQQADGDLTGVDAHRHPDAGHAARGNHHHERLHAQRERQHAVEAPDDPSPARRGLAMALAPENGVAVERGRPRAAPAGRAGAWCALWLLWPTHTGRSRQMVSAISPAASTTAPARKRTARRGPDSTAAMGRGRRG